MYLTNKFFLKSMMMIVVVVMMMVVVMIIIDIKFASEISSQDHVRVQHGNSCATHIAFHCSISN
jgi:hypothetical protein